MAKLHEVEVLSSDVDMDRGSGVVRDSTRLRVDGGWIYRIQMAMGDARSSALSVSQQFVPDSDPED